MACDDCLGAGLHLDGNDEPAVNPDPLDGIKVNGTTCYAGLKVRLPLGVGRTAQPSAAGAGQGLHQDANGFLWASPPGEVTDLGTVVGPNSATTPGGTGDTVVEDLSWSYTNTASHSRVYQFAAMRGNVSYGVGNGDDFRTQSRVDLVAPGQSFDTGWQTHTRGAVEDGALNGTAKILSQYAQQSSFDNVVLAPAEALTIRYRRRISVVAVGGNGGYVNTAGSVITITRYDTGEDT